MEGHRPAPTPHTRTGTSWGQDIQHSLPAGFILSISSCLPPSSSLVPFLSPCAASLFSSLSSLSEDVGPYVRTTTPHPTRTTQACGGRVHRQATHRPYLQHHTAAETAATLPTRRTTLFAWTTTPPHGRRRASTFRTARAGRFFMVLDGHACGVRWAYSGCCLDRRFDRRSSRRIAKGKKDMEMKKAGIYS